MLDWRWNSESLLGFTHVVLTRTLSTQKARDIGARIDLRLDLWERGIHSGLVGEALAEGRTREGQSKISNVEYKNSLARIFHSTMLSGKLRHAVRWSTNHERGGVSSQEMSARRPGNRLQTSSGRSTAVCVYSP